MFTNFSNFTEGFKNFSLDALQDDEDANKNDDNKRIGTDEDVPHTQPVLPPVPKAPPATTERVPNKEDDEWEWDQEDTTSGGKSSGYGKNNISDEPGETRLVPSLPFSSSGTLGGTLPTASAMHTPVLPATASAGRFALDGNAPEDDRIVDKPEARQNVVEDKALNGVVTEPSAACGETTTVVERGQSGQNETSQNSAQDLGVGQDVADEMARTTMVSYLIELSSSPSSCCFLEWIPTLHATSFKTISIPWPSFLVFNKAPIGSAACRVLR